MLMGWGGGGGLSNRTAVFVAQGPRKDDGLALPLVRHGLSQAPPGPQTSASEESVVGSGWVEEGKGR